MSDSQGQGTIRKWMNEHSGITTLTVLASIVLAGVFIFRNLGNRLSEPPADLLWYYDLAEHKLVALPDTVPIGAKSVLRAYTFTCGDTCDDVSKLVVRYYETWKPEAAEHMARCGTKKYAEFGSDLWYEGRMVSKKPEGPWVEFNSKAGLAVQAAKNCPDNSAPRECYGAKG